MTPTDLIPQDEPTQRLLVRTLAAMFKHWQHVNHAAEGDQAGDHAPSEPGADYFKANRSKDALKRTHTQGIERMS
jgi:hypothetical protein